MYMYNIVRSVHCMYRQCVHVATIVGLDAQLSSTVDRSVLLEQWITYM